MRQPDSAGDDDEWRIEADCRIWAACDQIDDNGAGRTDRERLPGATKERMRAHAHQGFNKQRRGYENGVGDEPVDVPEEAVWPRRDDMDQL